LVEKPEEEKLLRWMRRW